MNIDTSHPLELVSVCFLYLDKCKEGHEYILLEKGKKGMEEMYEITRERAHKAAMKNKRLYESEVRSSVLQPGGRILVRNLTPHGCPAKLRSHWEMLSRQFVGKSE